MTKDLKTAAVKSIRRQKINCHPFPGAVVAGTSKKFRYVVLKSVSRELVFEALRSYIYVQITFFETSLKAYFL